MPVVAGRSLPAEWGDEATGYGAKWLAAPALARLVSAFALHPDERRLAAALAAGAPRETGVLARLDAFTDRWDTRGGKERREARALEMTSHQEAMVLEAATALGLRGGPPARFSTYDHVLVLGGTLRGCRVRTGEAARLLNSGRLGAKAVTALGGHRPFSPEEFTHAAAIGHSHLREEFQALDSCAREMFGLGEPERVVGEDSAEIGATWGVRHYRNTVGLPVRVAAAPSRTPGRRADTADTYAFFADRLGQLRSESQLLLVTSAVNVPAQHFTALRMLALPYGARIDTVGHTAESVPPALAWALSATEYLLEIRSAVRALRRLREASAVQGA
ncbi:hypothetical protein [Streptomyces sp. NPDC059398]|uniref:hypothetical protein n=1 Tax=Streptomyces sp. NPDC059398 TaxID=3346820 RepID=UPI003693C3B1